MTAAIRNTWWRRWTRSRRCRSRSTPAEAAPLLCAGITTFNALRHSGALPGDLVAVQGIGGLGHLRHPVRAEFGYQVAAIGAARKCRVATSSARACISTARRPTGGRIAETRRRARDPGHRAELEGHVVADRRPRRERPDDGEGATTDPIEATPFQLISGRKEHSGLGGPAPQPF